MIIQADAKSLEIYCLAFLSNDQVLLEELRNNMDMHSLNQKALGLPAGDEYRVIAKIFVFRLAYGGSAFSYAHDSDFMGVSKSEKYWQQRIDNFYDKYKGVKQWHDTIVREATQNGKLRMPTGREYLFPLVRDYKGDLVPPRTTILNYPVNNSGFTW